MRHFVVYHTLAKRWARYPGIRKYLDDVSFDFVCQLPQQQQHLLPIKIHHLLVSNSHIFCLLFSHLCTNSQLISLSLLLLSLPTWHIYPTVFALLTFDLFVNIPHTKPVNALLYISLDFCSFVIHHPLMLVTTVSWTCTMILVSFVFNDSPWKGQWTNMMSFL